MKIQIIIKNDIPNNCDAQIKRATFDQIMQQKNIAPIPNQTVVPFGKLFEDSYSLLISDAIEMNENVLHVSKEIKEKYYSYQVEINI